MSELRVTRWHRYGHDRLYLNASDGGRVGWVDLHTGEIVVEAAEQREAVEAALREYWDAHDDAAPRDPQASPLTPAAEEAASLPPSGCQGRGQSQRRRAAQQGSARRPCQQRRTRVRPRGVDRSYRTVTLQTYRAQADEALQQTVDVLAALDAEMAHLRGRIDELESSMGSAPLLPRRIELRLEDVNRNRDFACARYSILRSCATSSE